MSGNMMEWLKDRMGIMANAAKAVPFVKYAIGIVGFAAGLSAILSLLKGDVALAAIGLPCLMIAAAVLYVMSRLNDTSALGAAPPARRNWLIEPALGVLVAVGVLCACAIPILAMTCYFLGKPLDWRPLRPVTPPTAEQQVIDVKQSVQSEVRGNFEARNLNPGAKELVRKEGMDDAMKFTALEGKPLDFPRQILLQEYRGWVYSMMARTFDAKSESAERLAYAHLAIESLQNAANLMDQAYVRMAGDDSARATWEWVMSSDSHDYARVHTQLAIMKAALIEAGESIPPTDIEREIKLVDGAAPDYLHEYPSEQLTPYLN